MDLSDLALILFGAGLTYSFGELRAYFDRREERAVREEERAARERDAVQERQRTLRRRVVADTRATLLAMLDDRIRLGLGQPVPLRSTDEHSLYDPTIVPDSDLLAAIIAAGTDIDPSTGGRVSWEQIVHISQLKTAITRMMRDQEERIAAGRDLRRLDRASEPDLAGVANAIAQLEEWKRSITGVVNGRAERSPS